MLLTKVRNRALQEILRGGLPRWPSTKRLRAAQPRSQVRGPHRNAIHGVAAAEARVASTVVRGGGGDSAHRQLNAEGITTKQYRAYWPHKPEAQQGQAVRGLAADARDTLLVQVSLRH